jgi:hypothetical protein
VTSKANSAGGVGFFSILFFILLEMKLTHVIEWSWWWVTAPLWVPVAVFAVYVVITLGREL